MTATDKPSIAELQLLVVTSRRRGDGLLRLRDAAPVLLEIVDLALAWSGRYGAMTHDEAVVNVQELLTALEKVRP